MSLRNNRELANTQRKLRLLEQGYEEARNDTQGGEHLRAYHCVLLVGPGFPKDAAAEAELQNTFDDQGFVAWASRVKVPAAPDCRRACIRNYRPLRYSPVRPSYSSARSYRPCTPRYVCIGCSRSKR